MKPFETVFILTPTLTADDTEKVIERSSQVIRDGGGEVVRVEKLGRKKLAYSIARQTEGFYVQLQFKGTGPVVSELERTLRQSESVLRFLTALSPEEVGRRRAERLRRKADKA